MGSEHTAFRQGVGLTNPNLVITEGQRTDAAAILRSIATCKGRGPNQISSNS